MSIIHTAQTPVTTSRPRRSIWSMVCRFFADVSKGLHSYRRPPHA